MINAEFDENASRGQIVLKPNRSWTWRANTYLVGSLMVISGVVAGVFTVNGMWLILPFTVLEMSVLTACLYYCVRRTHTTEVLTLSKSTLVFERGVNKPTQRFDFDRYFSRFFIEAATHPWYKKRINLRCREQQFEVGSFLSNEEKDHLISQLRQMIRRLDEPWQAPVPAD
jgi:uncharacterized membrane protein